MSGRLMIKCRQAHQLLSERMDRPISATERLRLWVHLRWSGAAARDDRRSEADHVE